MKAKRTNIWRAVPVVLALILVGIIPARAGQKETISAYFSPGGGAREAIYREIEAARGEILVAMYTFTSKSLAFALCEARKKGIKVMVIGDKQQRDVRYSKYEHLEKNGVPVRYMEAEGGGRSKAMRAKFHHKFAVMDKRVVISGSFNWTSIADEKNYENVLIIRYKKLAETFRKEFRKLWKEAEPYE